MPGEGHDPNAPPPDGHPETTGRPDAAVTLDGTIEQVAPPAWAVSGNSSTSNVSRSGKEVHQLDREIERSQSEGGTDAAEGYVLIRKLGTGSFGAVWEAEDRLTNERVAIKFFTASDSDWEKLLSEVGLLQAVEGCHGIVMVKQVRPGVGGRRPHYVMQLANRGSLADWLKTAATLPPRERVRQAVAFFTHVARAMAAVHRRGIHHCDLKPHNILLHSAEPGGAPEPLVADFGQAHLATDDTPALGTFFYMPPDQIDSAMAGTPPDTRWDTYALGAVVYEMLTGEPPRRSPELAERIKKSPKHLPTRMTVYREGIVSAPKPDAHHKIADPVLAKIIDRCLNLSPDQRPADAGAVVALLDARARWRRIRPLLTLAALATLLVISIVASAGAWAAKAVTKESEQNVTAELMGSLARTAGYSVPAVERRLQRQVANVERAADTAPPDVMKHLTKLNTGKHGSRFDSTAVSAQERESLARWLADILSERKKITGGNDTVASVGLVLVTDSDVTGGQRGFFLARAHPDGTVEYAGHTDAPDVFTRDFSFRDYFHGTGNLADEEGQPHSVVRSTHISDPYRSKGDDRTFDGKRISRPWKVDIVTPLWDSARGRVVGLLIFGLNLERDIVSLLEPTELSAKGIEHLGIAKKVKVVLIDHRHRWVWHPDCRGSLRDDRPDLRLPHSYDTLARECGWEPVQALPWMRIGEPEAGQRFGYIESGEYVDLVESVRDDGDRNDAPEIACFTRFSPYVLSRYPEARPRQWVFVAQVDRHTALAPLSDLRAKIVRVGAVAGLVLALIVAGLWVGLVVVLRRLEFVSHG